MITQMIDGISYELRQFEDFSFLSKYGKVFTVFDQNDSGNISFGVVNDTQRYFIKIAGANTKEMCREPEEAVEALKNAMRIYESLEFPHLIELVEHYSLRRLYVAVFKWTEGECLFDYWNFKKYSQNPNLKSPITKFKELPIQFRLESVDIACKFLAYTNSRGYVAIDFYDGSILYDFQKHITSICDIDFFRKKPTFNDMGGNFWGTKRLKSPEEYTYGATIDEVTNVFTMGALIFHFFGSYSNMEIRKMYKDNKFSPCSLEKWELNVRLYEVALRAVDQDREKRYKSIKEFWNEWTNTLKE